MATSKKSSSVKTTAAKKPAAKSKVAPAKKPATKKTKAAAPARTLVCAEGEYCFWTANGQVLKDLLELRDALAEMDELIFNEHVTAAKNDFADWVEHVLRDNDCAQALRRAKKPHTARTAVVRHLRLYSF